MTEAKRRLTVTVDPELVEAGNRAVAAGRADSLSGWVNTALGEKAARERRQEALGEAIAGYEAEFGEITGAEMEAQRRADSETAIVVRGRPAKAKRRPPARKGAA